jgi:hypothetical protein
MKLEVKRVARGARPLFVAGDRVIAARGLDLIEWRDAGVVRSPARLPAGFTERMLSLSTLTRLGLRLGLHAAVPVSGGALLAVLKRRFVLIGRDGSAEVVDKVHRGNKPAARAVAVLPDGRVLYGEYCLNNDRSQPVALYRTDDPRRGFAKLFEFSPGRVRHIHFVQHDPYESCLWMGTGDQDAECGLYRSGDAGTTWTRVGGGSQIWRSIGVAFTPDSIYWGMDAGSDAGDTPNFIVRFDRAKGTADFVQRVQGPCHGVGKLADGTLFVSTGVEGGRNEMDRSTHLWMSRDGSAWTEAFSRPKNFWPSIAQFGVLRIPPGTESGRTLHFAGLALRGAAETWFRGDLRQE